MLRTDIEYDEVTNLLEPDSRIPVLIGLVPARLGYDDSETALAEADARITELIGNGLRAGLAPGSILTGQKYVELQYHDVPSGGLQTFASHKVIPSIDDRLGQLLNSAAGVLDTINRLPLDTLADTADVALRQMTATLAEIQKSAAGLENMLANPASEQLVGSLNAALVGFQQLAISFSDGSATNRELQESLRALERSLRELEPALRNSRRKPNSLIFGIDEQEDVEPQGGKE